MVNMTKRVINGVLPYNKLLAKIANNMRFKNIGGRKDTSTIYPPNKSGIEIDKIKANMSINHLLLERKPITRPTVNKLIKMTAVGSGLFIRTLKWTMIGYVINRSDIRTTRNRLGRLICSVLFNMTAQCSQG